MRAPLLALACIFTAACASTPQPSAKLTSPTPPINESGDETGTIANADAQANVTTEAQEPGAAPSEPGTRSTAATTRKKGFAGLDDYEVVERNGVKYYCTAQPSLGTRLPKRTTCMTAEQYQRAQAEAQEKMRERQGQRRWQE